MIEPSRHLILGVAVAWLMASAASAATPAIPLNYDAALAAQGFPNPFVTLTIGTQRARFIIDTGAGVHTFAAWFVASAGLRTQPSKSTVTGSTGTETPVDMVVNVTGMLEGGGRLRLAQAAVTTFPPIFEQQRIAGLLSPQLLAGRGEEAVLDLARPRLTFRRASRDDASSAGATKARATSVCTNPGSPFVNRLYATSVTVDGVTASLLIDTGATRTTISADSAAGRRLVSRGVLDGQNQGVGGAVNALRRVPAVTIERGGSTAIMDVRVGAIGNSCGPDGLLGMDGLARCVLILGPARGALTCPAAMR